MIAVRTRSLLPLLIAFSLAGCFESPLEVEPVTCVWEEIWTHYDDNVVTKADTLRFDCSCVYTDDCPEDVTQLPRLP